MSGVLLGFGVVLILIGIGAGAAAMGSSYVNAGNIRVPIAIYSVGSTDPVVAVLLAQLLVIAPIHLTVCAWSGAPLGTGRCAPTCWRGTNR